MSIQITKHKTSDTGGGVAQDRKVVPAMLHGLMHRCPACGKGNIYSGFLKVADHCPQCNEALYHHRADDAPPYFTIFIVGHLVVGGVLALEKAAAPEAWVHAVIWVPLTLFLSLLMLPRIKGAFVGLQWALRMHGFAASAQPENLQAAKDTETGH